MSIPTQEVSLPSPDINAFSTQVHHLRDVWRLVRLNRKVAFGLGILSVFVLIAILGPIFLRQDPNSFSSDILSPPSASHWLGTTQTGQDVFLQLVVGARTSLVLGFVTGLVATIISVIVMGCACVALSNTYYAQSRICGGCQGERRVIAAYHFL